jgi:hypothetical protein
MKDKQSWCILINVDFEKINSYLHILNYTRFGRDSIKFPTPIRLCVWPCPCGEEKQ